MSAGTVKSQLLLIVENRVTDLGVRELPENKHYEVKLEFVEVPCNCPEKECGK